MAGSPKCSSALRGSNPGCGSLKPFENSGFGKNSVPKNEKRTTDDGQDYTTSPEKSGEDDYSTSAATSACASTHTSNSDGASDDTSNDEDLEAAVPQQSAPLHSVFSSRQKAYIVTMVTIAAFISPTSANIYFPALNDLSKDLNVSNTLINLTLTSYMIFQGLAPTFMGDLADMAGRRPAYILGFTIYLGANIGLALQNNYAALFILRCLQSSGSSGAIALSYGTVADISTSAERGRYAGLVGAGTTLGPAIGPVIGGLLVEYLGWRSIFWFLVIFASAWLVPFILTVPETGRNVVGNGSMPPQGWNMTVVEYLKLRRQRKAESALTRTVSAGSRRAAQMAMARKRKLRFPNPLRTIHIIMEKDVGLILFYNALIYTAFYDVMAAIPSQFSEIYDFNNLQIGLCYLPFGLGCCLSSLTNGRVLDKNYAKVAKQVGMVVDRKRGDDLSEFPIERARIELIWGRLFIGLASVIAFGWVLQQEVNLAAPLVLLFLIGYCVNGSYYILNNLLIDLYPYSPATATAANNLVRCLMGAAGTAIIDIMIDAMGRGWCFTLIGLVCTVTSPILLAVLKWGPGWREERRQRIERKNEEKENADAAADAESQRQEGSSAKSSGGVRRW